ncbi:NAD-dependent protein deacetylase [Duganella violaceipulchra]|uniref:NAD-dependent protein deacetylase n=1 Tax=Duganella violaceipulchra TaxID=2849652 RepID=A0AA41H4J7_9BURK|nr:NAD-dependent protein deacetylase [Duganella violaceicalia]MBV6319559.1 NAD-dependent protein deacetylase [Duganella violaceicalia]MCP2006629.1 NAD-dependent SIR2 family protein deacetylase [Duganella violaceicalia]
MNLNQQVDHLSGFLRRHRRVLVLTGAGLSTASGIPDYRDKDGVRRGRTPIQGPDFRKSEAVRRRYWARSMAGWPTLAQAAPNAGHQALAQLEAAGRIGALITQNVDGLHQRAGTSRLIELHGNIHGVVCLDCRALHRRADIQRWLVEANPGQAASAAAGADSVVPEARPDGDAEIELNDLQDFHMPSCDACGGTLQPDVIFFGDNIPAPRTAAALAMMEQADALLVVGSSLMVFSGYRFCKLAAATGKPIAAINLGKTRADELIGLKVAATASEVLPRLL